MPTIIARPNNLPKFRTPYAAEYRVPNRVQTTTEGVSLTRQEMKRETDINEIVNAYLKKGYISSINPKEPAFGDAPIIDYKTALDAVITADEKFQSLPAKLREFYRNDPQAFIDDLDSETPSDVLYEAGVLARPPQADAPAPDPETPSESPSEPPPAVGDG